MEVLESSTPGFFVWHRKRRRLNVFSLVREEEMLRQEITDFSLMKGDDWMPLGSSPHAGGKRVRLNVGGQVRVIQAIWRSLFIWKT